MEFYESTFLYPALIFLAISFGSLNTQDINETNTATTRPASTTTTTLTTVATAKPVTLRLVNSNGMPNEGRLEIFHAGVWGTVCDDNFSNVSARVACAILGFGHFGVFIGNRYAGGTGQIWLDNVMCRGNEARLEQCSTDTWGAHDCSHGEDVSISCVIVRLVNSSGNPNEGRLEILHAGVWGTVCGDGFNDTSARVACASLGYGHVGTFIGSRYGSGAGKIWMDDVVCNGTEASLDQCSRRSWDVHDCDHSKDVSISCGTIARLVNPTRYANEGRLEIYYADVWGTVCGDGFNDASTRVACASLGFGYIGTFIGSRYGSGTGQIWLDDVLCNGDETRLDQCRRRPLGDHDCDHSKDVSISCVTVRLVNSTGNPNEGRLEILHDGVWGTVCDDNFNSISARVACASLGFGHVGTFIGNRYGVGTGQIWMDDLACRGNETRLEQCATKPWGIHDCSHSEDVSISCVTVRLVNSTVNPNEGRLEVVHEGVWGTVCDDGFNNASAQVVCASLGFGHVGTFIGSVYGSGTGQIWLDDVVCNGNEARLELCSTQPWGVHNCNHSNDVSISCGTVARLANSTENPYEGRLEIYYAGAWGTVCDDGFNNFSARVACASLGFGHVGTFIGSIYGNGTDQIWLDDVVCDGSETRLDQCSARPLGDHNCDHSKDVSISCGTITRLVSPSGNLNEGRLEIYYAGLWGTVCRDGFNSASVGVACASLGFGHVGILLGSRYGSGTGQIWLDDVVCNGAETRLDQCSARPWGVHNCDHSKDVSISCVNMRLANSSGNLNEGRLEIYHAGAWGTVCKDYFNDVSAGVACASLGFSHIGYFIGNRYGGGTGPIWVNDVVCKGNETRLEQCEIKSWGINNCRHAEDVSIRCVIARLVNSTGNPNEGRLEIVHDGVWGTVCGDGFNNVSARVACASLGFGHFGIFLGSQYGSGTGKIWLDDVVCNGDETRLDQCRGQPLGDHNCDHSKDVSISCGTMARLVNPIGNPIEGRLEIYYAGVWGTVCDDGFNDANVRVACASLGFGYVGTFIGSRYGSGSGQIWLDDVACNGNEARLDQCRRQPLGDHNCDHNKDVSISCATVRLVNPTGNPNEGRLEIYYAGVWGTVCDDGFNNVSARVACASLGFGHVGTFIGTRYGIGTGLIWLDDINCKGNETRLDQCSARPWGSHDCSHNEDTSISCVTARLVNSTEYPNEGRLEIFHADVWGTVCEDGFNNVSARVACASLGFGHVGAFIGSRYGSGSGQIWLDDVACNGSETRLELCSVQPLGIHNCNHSKDVSISCGTVARLANFTENPYEGRLEIYYAGVWGTVCSDDFNDTSARVVCASLGFGQVGTFIGSVYGSGSGQIWLDDVVCNGNETRLDQCSARPWGVHNCDHSKDVSISCVSMARLVNPTGNPNEGRLEIFYAGVWGTVCSDGFNDASAQVACAHLGFGHVGTFIGSRYGIGTGKIWLDDVVCKGNETRLDQCSSARPWGVHDCNHSKDVSISCVNTRLSNSTENPNEGRLEIYHAGVWGTVCRHNFNNDSARVACASLGFGHVGVFIGSRYGGGTGNIWLDDVICKGNETRLEQCSARPWQVYDCSHAEDVSISCVTARLVNSTEYPNEGRLEIHHADVWGTVCGDGFNNISARVACASLGFGHVGAFIGSRYGSGSGQIWMDDVVCDGNETRLEQCSTQPWGIHNCDHSKDVSISCGTITRLANFTENPNEGRLEIYHAGVWGTVCGDGFNNVTARVACASLGYGAVGTFIGSRYGSGTGHIWLDDVVCNGNETRLDQCSARPWGDHDCDHSKDVSISCGTIARLANSSGSPKEGRLEIFYAGVWGTVCGDGFNDASVRVACASLGFGPVGTFLGSRYGSGTGQIWLDDVECNGDEKRLDQCATKPWGVHNCDHSTDISISCVAVRLVNSNGNPTEGRLEILRSGVWGTVCDDGFTNATARVACASLGFGHVGAFIGSRYGSGTGEIWLDDLVCTGNETDLSQCTVRPWGVHDCSHTEDVSISCVTARLESSTGNPNEGRLEIFHADVWGTVCSDGFNNVSAQVACASLGFGHFGAFIGSRYGNGSGEIWLDDVVCDGNETRLEQCSAQPWGIHNCDHSKDVSISCGTLARLVNSSVNPKEGRLEIYYAGVWGTVCGDSFNDVSARVACASLGFGYVGNFIGSRYGSGIGQIWLDDVVCNGNETRLDLCSTRPWGDHDCDHNKDVSISCGTMVRLVNSSGRPKEGRLEIYYAGDWGTICGDSFNDVSARVACASLGFGRVGTFIGSQYGSGTGQIWLDDVDCNGSETTLDQCSAQPWGVHNCDHRKDVSISCGISRLVNPTGNPNEGRLEILHEGVWGTVCDDNFNNFSARVACASLGFGHVGAFIGTRYGAGTGRIWLDDFVCSGTETELEQCSTSGWGTHNCNHDEDASISCGTITRLVNSTGNPNEGRLEIYYAGVWGTVCRDGFTDANARVACASLGFGPGGTYIGFRYGGGTGQIWLDNVVCKGNETKLEQCSTLPWGVNDCNHNEDVSISCVSSQSTANLSNVSTGTHLESTTTQTLSTTHLEPTTVSTLSTAHLEPTTAPTLSTAHMEPTTAPTLSTEVTEARTQSTTASVLSSASGAHIDHAESTARPTLTLPLTLSSSDMSRNSSNSSATTENVFKNPDASSSGHGANLAIGIVSAIVLGTIVLIVAVFLWRRYKRSEIPYKDYPGSIDLFAFENKTYEGNSETESGLLHDESQVEFSQRHSSFHTNI